jgi:hypothetical protein
VSEQWPTVREPVAARPFGASYRRSRTTSIKDLEGHHLLSRVDDLPGSISAASRTAGLESHTEPPPSEGTRPRPPAVQLPRGGGAIRGIGDLYRAEPAGTGPVQQPAQLDPSRSGSAERYTYDGQSNMLTLAPIEVLRWNHLNRLVGSSRHMVAATGLAEITYYVYDGTGQRVRNVTDRAAAPSAAGASRRAERLYVGDFESYRTFDAGGAATLARTTMHVNDGAGTHGRDGRRRRSAADRPQSVQQSLRLGGRRARPRHGADLVRGVLYVRLHCLIAHPVLDSRPSGPRLQSEAADTSQDVLTELLERRAMPFTVDRARSAGVQIRCRQRIASHRYFVLLRNDEELSVVPGH